MKTLTKALILMEVVLSFGPALILLGMGFIILPFGLSELFNGNVGGAPLVLLVASGSIGLMGILSIIVSVFPPHKPLFSKSKTYLFLSLGIVAAISGSIVIGPYAWIFALPSIVATIHLAFLTKNFFNNVS